MEFNKFGVLLKIEDHVLAYLVAVAILLVFKFKELVLAPLQTCRWARSWALWLAAPFLPLDLSPAEWERTEMVRVVP